MLCENCKALRCEGYEYPEEYCLIQSEDNIRDLKKGPGCYLREKTICKKISKVEEKEGKYYDSLAKAYAIECLEKKTDILTEYIGDLKNCLGLFNYNCPKPKKRGQKKIYNLIWNKVVVKRTDTSYERYRELELCGFVNADKSYLEDCDPFKKPDMNEPITFWIIKEGFEWLSKQDSHGPVFVEYKYLQGPAAYLSVEDKKQAEAYAKRDKIKVGDRFVWRRSKTRKDEYITSGKLKDKYMYSPDFPYMESGILEVYKVYEGKNGYGPFVDYWLKDTKKETKEFHIIINGVDAMKMKRNV